jgi:hypothetical protein
MTLTRVVPLPRRSIMAGLIASVTLLPRCTAVSSFPFIPSPAFNVETWGKLTADVSGQTVFAFTQGHVYGFKPQADDLSLNDFAKVLYGYQTCSARKAHFRGDGSVVIRQRTWTWYQDPNTGAFIDALTNSYTGGVVPAKPMGSRISEQAFTLDGPDFTRAPFPVDSSEKMSLLSSITL